jgi:hypothetical protein
MKAAICLQPYIPIRSSASEAAEMVNQLIFGDTFRILEEVPRWYRIIRDYDDYEGWVDWKTVSFLSDQDYLKYNMQASTALLLRQPYNVISRNTAGQSVSLHLSWGSRIFNLDDMGISFHMQGIRFDVPNMTYVNPVNATSMSRTACAKYLIQQAQMLVNVPYLWGGCTAFGFDCSGFTQTLYRFINIRMPRNASQQALLGEEVKYEERACGDLAFFNHGEADGHISHVGVCDDQGRILHCSASLHYDEFRPEGIWSTERNELTHSLVIIKRYF